MAQCRTFRQLFSAFICASAVFILSPNLWANSENGRNQCSKLISAQADSSASAETSAKTSSQHSSQTENLIAYLSDLLSNQIIGDDEIVHMIEGLSRGELLNPISEEKTWVNSAALVHRDAIEDYIGGSALNSSLTGGAQLAINSDQLRTWAISALKEKTRVRDLRSDTKVQTQDLFAKIKFLPVQAGRVKLKPESVVIVSKPKVVVITRDFEMTATPITQGQWVDLMGENPAHFSDGDASSEFIVNGKTIKLRENYPIEQITWWSALEFANRLSISQGLQPAYDLSEIPFATGTSAEKGTLRPFSIHSPVLKVNAPGGDIYRAEGYRLPTAAEYTYLLNSGTPVKNGRPLKYENALLTTQAKSWYHTGGNGKSTYEVAKYDPIIFNGQKFFDLIGNLWQMTNDYDSIIQPTGRDPKGQKFGTRRTVCGGYTISADTGEPNVFRAGSDPFCHSMFVGFRLVRTMPNAGAKSWRHFNFWPFRSKASSALGGGVK